MSRGFSSTIPTPHLIKCSMSEERPEGEEIGRVRAVVKERTGNKTNDAVYEYPAGMAVQSGTF
jgi:hypothetical protein